MNFDKDKQAAFLAEQAKDALPELADQAYEAIVQLRGETQTTPTTLLGMRDWIALEASGFCITHAFDEGYKYGLRAPQQPWRNFVAEDGTDKTARLIANVNSAIDEHLRQVARLEELRGQLSRAVLEIKDALATVKAANETNTDTSDEENAND